MNFSEFCIRRPVMTISLSLAIVALGLFSYTQLPIAALPSYNQPVITVNGTLPGASPDIMAATVATPLEKEFQSIAGVNAITSSSTLGESSITLEFNPERNIDAAAVDVQAALIRAQRNLPLEMNTLPTYQKVNPSDSPVIFMGLSSPSVSLSALNDYAENLIAPTLAGVDGVAKVNVYGQRRYAVRVKARINELAARNMTMEEMANAIRSANSNSPLGTIDGQRQSLVLAANEQLRNAAAFADLIIKTRDGTPLRLKDVAQVEDSVEAVRNGTWLDGQQSIVLAVQRQPNANIVKVVDGIKAVFPRFKSAMPASIRIRVLSDYSIPIRDAIADVQFSLVLAIALVVLVIFLFLKHWSATAIPVLSLPISLLGCFALMFWCGYSLNNISLLALTISVGLVVDDAIVMLENIVRHMELGAGPMEAALKGSREVGFTIISISVSLAAVFLPIFFMPGVIGQMFHEFALVVVMAVMVSALVSLSLVPLLCGRYLRHDAAATEGWLTRRFEQGFGFLQNAYAHTLDWCLAHRKSMLLLAALSLLATVMLYITMPKGFFPREDVGLIRAYIEGPQDASYATMTRLVAQAATRVQNDAQVDSVLSRVTGGNTGSMFIGLKPRAQREGMNAVLARLRGSVRDIPEVAVYFNPIQNVWLGGKSAKSQYQYVLQSVHGDELAGWSEQLLAKMRAEAIFSDVNSDLQMNGLQAVLDIDRNRANLAGVQIQDIRSALYNAWGERQISTIFTAGNSYKVLMQDSEVGAQTEQDVTKIHVRASNGNLVPLSALATVRRSAGVVAVNHEGQLQTITLSFELKGGATLAQAEARLTQIKAGLNLPASIVGSFAGDAAVSQSSQGKQLLLLLFSLALIYVLLSVLYESFIHPVTILMGLPSAAVGALLALRLFGFDLSLIATIGILMLIGIVKKNAIMMIDFALDAQRRQGTPPLEAIRSACLLRFRPIMMTTIAALVGALPLAFGLGAGAELRQPLGVAVVGGLLLSQVITLCITPVLYLTLERFSRQRSSVPPATGHAVADAPGHPI